MKQVLSEQEAFLRLATLCAQEEHCEKEMRDKMKRWELDEAIQEKVISHLRKERYIDDERYARAFVKDKIRYNKWGRKKIEQALWLKQIDQDIQQRVLNEVDENEYLYVLKSLLKQKRKTIKAESNYEFNQKLMRFALSRGFDFSIIRQCIDVDEEDETY